MNTFICCKREAFINELKDCQIKVFSNRKDAEAFSNKNKDFYFDEVKDFENINFSNKKSDKSYRLVMTKIEYGGCGPDDYTSESVFYVNMTKDEYKSLKKSLPVLLKRKEDVPEFFGNGDLFKRIEKQIASKCPYKNDCYDCHSVAFGYVSKTNMCDSCVDTECDGFIFTIE